MLNRFIIPVENHPAILTQEKLQKIECDKEKLINISKKYIAEGIEILCDLVDFLKSEKYKQNSKLKVGVGQYPNGKEYYQYLLNYHTTYDITPEEIYRIGYENIEKIEKSMKKIRRKIGYDCTRLEFKEKIKNMPELYEKTPQGIGNRLNSYLDEIRPKMKDYFDNLCSIDCEVVRLPIKKEKAITFGLYSGPNTTQPKGQYLYNGSYAEEKNQIGAGSIIYHELLPGHHFQIIHINQNNELHPLFKTLMYTANIEGWAEYASELAGEMGMYKNPLDEYGRLTLDLFQSTRLVVDTGINVFGWSRKKAVDLLRRNSEFSDQMIFSEINRYSNDIPAQALGYKFGSLKMLEIKEKAKKTLGDKFDVKEYHTKVLEIGFAPLKILEKHIDWYLEEKLKISENKYK